MNVDNFERKLEYLVQNVEGKKTLAERVLPRESPLPFICFLGYSKICTAALITALAPLHLQSPFCSDFLSCRTSRLMGLPDGRAGW